MRARLRLPGCASGAAWAGFSLNHEQLGTVCLHAMHQHVVALLLKPRSRAMLGGGACIRENEASVKADCTGGHAPRKPQRTLILQCRDALLTPPHSNLDGWQ